MQRCTHCGMERRGAIRTGTGASRTRWCVPGSGRCWTTAPGASLRRSGIRAVKQQPVSDVTLIKIFGSWGAVVAAFGL